MNAAALILAVQLTHAESLSARPDAPVIPCRERSRRRPLSSARLSTARLSTARALRRVAERVEPSRPNCG